MSALRLISDTALEDGVSTVSIENCFSADFDIYKITIDNLTHNSGSPAEIYFKFINSTGNVVSASNYDSASRRMPSYASFGQTKIQNHTQTVVMGYADLSPEGSGS